MIAYIFYPIFTLTITILVCFIQKKHIVWGFVSTPSPRHHLRPPGRGRLKPLPRPPVAIIFGFSKNRRTHIFSVLFPVYVYILGFPISILVLGGALPPPLSSGGEQSVSAYVNILTSAIALHTLLPLSLTFSEEKGDTPS